MRSRPFTAFSPVALRLATCALVAACLILSVSPLFAVGQTYDEPNLRIERSGQTDRLVPPADVPCSAREWHQVAACYIPATEAAPANIFKSKQI